MTTTVPAPRLGASADRRTTVLDWVGLAARLVLGVVLIWAGASKVGDLGNSVLAVRGYKLVPYDLSAPIGYVLPFLEIIVGLLLVLGLFTRVAAILGGLMMAAFVFGIAWAWSHGYAIDCGCFGGGGPLASFEEAQAKYPWEIARDLGLFLCAAFLVWRPRTPFSLDGWLFRPLPALDLADDETYEENPA